MKREPNMPGRVVVLENSERISAETEAIQRRIRQRAFELSQTRPADAHEIYDWIVAESQTVSVPPAELVERNGNFEMKFAIAGVDPDDVNVLVTADQLVLRSDYNHEHDPESGTVHLCDFRSATVFRSIDLPRPIDVNSVKLEFSNGLLRVTAAVRSAVREQPAPPKQMSVGQRQPAIGQAPPATATEQQTAKRTARKSAPPKKGRSRMP